MGNRGRGGGRQGTGGRGGAPSSKMCCSGSLTTLHLNVGKEVSERLWCKDVFHEYFVCMLGFDVYMLRVLYKHTGYKRHSAYAQYSLPACVFVQNFEAYKSWGNLC